VQLRAEGTSDTFLLQDYRHLETCLASVLARGRNANPSQWHPATQPPAAQWHHPEQPRP
jgi:hypothetical protein